MAKPTDAELDALTPHLFLFQDLVSTLLPHVAHDPSLDSLFDPIAALPQFSDISFGVLLYRGATGVRAYFHNPDENWDIGSGGKTSILTAAVVLRNDLRALQGASLVTAANADDLLRYVWTRHNRLDFKKLSNDGNYPQPSKIFDFLKSPIDFEGGPSDFDFLKLLAPDTIEPNDLSAITFRDRLHLTIGHSDNRAARASQGQLGIAYINAVLQQLGLYSPQQDTGFRVAGPYSVKESDLPKGWRQPVAIKRALGKGAGGRVTDIPYCATARTLAMLMTSMMRNTFPGAEGPNGLRDFLLKRSGFSYRSFALEGVQLARQGMGLSDVPTVAYSKLGILWANEEFLYVEFGPVRFGLVMLGLLPKSKKWHGGARGWDLASNLYPLIHGLPW